MAIVVTKDIVRESARLPFHGIMPPILDDSHKDDVEELENNRAHDIAMIEFRYQWQIAAAKAQQEFWKSIDVCAALKGMIDITNGR